MRFVLAGLKMVHLDLGLAKRDDGTWITMSLDHYRDLKDKKVAACWALDNARHKDDTSEASNAELDKNNKASSNEDEPITSILRGSLRGSLRGLLNRFLTIPTTLIGARSLSPQWLQTTLDSRIKNQARKVDRRPRVVRLMSLKKSEVAINRANEATTNGEVV